jgi:hypothetical protein
VGRSRPPAARAVPRPGIPARALRAICRSRGSNVTWSGRASFPMAEGQRLWDQGGIVRQGPGSLRLRRTHGPRRTCGSLHPGGSP